jgi:hypothetical protein
MTGDHVTTFALDALALDALAPDEVAKLHAHLAGCTTCRTDYERANDDRDHFMRHVLPKRRVSHRPTWRWLIAAPVAMAAVIAVVLWIGGTRESSHAVTPELAIKGGATWQVFASRGSKVFQVHDGDRLQDGDQIRFVVIPDGAHYLMIASIDGAGRASIYYPYDGRSSATIRGPRVEVDGSIVLDDAPGAERLFAILTDEPVDSERVERLLRAVGAGGLATIRATQTLDLPAREQLSLLVEK